MTDWGGYARTHAHLLNTPWEVTTAHAQSSFVRTAPRKTHLVLRVEQEHIGVHKFPIIRSYTGTGESRQCPLQCLSNTMATASPNYHQPWNIILWLMVKNGYLWRSPFAHKPTFAAALRFCPPSACPSPSHAHSSHTCWPNLVCQKLTRRCKVPSGSVSWTVMYLTKGASRTPVQEGGDTLKHAYGLMSECHNAQMSFLWLYFNQFLQKIW